MLNEYLKNNLCEMTKDNEVFLTEDLTNCVFSEWNEKLESFTHICDLYDYGFRFYEDGRIVMEDRFLEDSNCEWKGKSECGHLEYQSIEDMLKDWLDEIKNNEYIKSILYNEIKFIEQLNDEDNSDFIQKRRVIV